MYSKIEIEAYLFCVYFALQEIDVHGKKAIIIFVPVPQLRAYQKIQSRLVRELEKKFSGKHVVFIAQVTTDCCEAIHIFFSRFFSLIFLFFVSQRRILPKPTRKSRQKNKQKRPRSRTLTAVHDSMLEDLVFPAEIVGKRIRVKMDGARLFKVHLDKSNLTNIEHKVGVLN